MSADLWEKLFWFVVYCGVPALLVGLSKIIHLLL